MAGFFSSLPNFAGGAGLGFNMNTLNLVGNLMDFGMKMKKFGLEEDAMKQNMAISKNDFNNTLKRQEKFDRRSEAVNNQMMEYEKGNSVDHSDPRFQSGGSPTYDHI